METCAQKGCAQRCQDPHFHLGIEKEVPPQPEPIAEVATEDEIIEDILEMDVDQEAPAEEETAPAEEEPEKEEGEEQDLQASMAKSLAGDVESMSKFLV